MTSEDNVDRDLLKILCCPACRGSLEHRSQDSELYCSACAFTYPIVDGIPVLFPLDVKAHFDELFGRYWDSVDRADEYDKFVEGGESMLGMHNSEGEIRATLEVLGDLGGHRLLDCGCGNGRFFDQFPEDLFSVGIDASLNLLRICRRKGRSTRLVCCELEHLPFVNGFFDRVLSVRVLQHLVKQQEALIEMTRALAPGGELILHLYNQLSTKTISKTIRMSPRLQPLFNAPRNMARVLQDDLEAAGLPTQDSEGCPLVFHSLRHTCGTWLNELGVDDAVVQLILGHRTRALTTDRYQHARLERAAEAMTRLPELAALRSTGTDAGDNRATQPPVAATVGVEVTSEASGDATADAGSTVSRSDGGALRTEASIGVTTNRDAHAAVSDSTVGAPALPRSVALAVWQGGPESARKSHAASGKKGGRTGNLRLSAPHDEVRGPRARRGRRIRHPRLVPHTVGRTSNPWHHHERHRTQHLAKHGEFVRGRDHPLAPTLDRHAREPDDFGARVGHASAHDFPE